MATKKKVRPLVIKIEIRLTLELLYARLVAFGLPLPPEISTIEKFKKRINAEVNKIPELMDLDAIMAKIPVFHISDLDEEMQQRAKTHWPDAMNKLFGSKIKKTSGFRTKRPVA